MKLYLINDITNEEFLKKWEFFIKKQDIFIKNFT